MQRIKSSPIVILLGLLLLFAVADTTQAQGQRRAVGAGGIPGQTEVLAARLTDLETLVAEQAAQILALQGENAEQAAEISQLKAEDVTLRTDVTGLQTDVTGLQTAVAGLETLVAPLSLEGAAI